MIQKLDYRCRAIGCAKGNHCRRFLTGDAAKNSAVPFAAFDGSKGLTDGEWASREAHYNKSQCLNQRGIAS